MTGILTSSTIRVLVSEYCIKIIGGAQKLLSLFGLQWFCDEAPFLPLPNFNRPPTRSLLLEGNSLLLVLSNLGGDFFIFKYAGGGWGRAGRWGAARGVAACMRGALLALESLCQVSLVALDNVISQLQQEITATKTNSNS